MNDQDYMRLALEEAWKGCGFVNPNPMVGAVIVKNGCVIGRGAHAVSYTHLDVYKRQDCNRAILNTTFLDGLPNLRRNIVHIFTVCF